MAAAGKTGPFWVDTLANLKLLGTDDKLAVGNPAYDTTTQRMVLCLTAAASASTWGYKQRVPLRVGLNTSSAAQRFFPFKGTTTLTTLEGGWNGTQGYWCVHPTTVLAVIVQQDTDPGSTTIAVHKGLSNTTFKDITDTPSGADVAHEYDFSGESADYVAGEMIGVSQDPTNAPTARTTATLIIEETITL